MSVRLFCNVVYAWIMSSAGGDSETRERIDADIYAPARGLEQANASFWAAIHRAPEE